MVLYNPWVITMIPIIFQPFFAINFFSAQRVRKYAYVGLPILYGLAEFVEPYQNQHRREY